jgi:hypothetical protein
MKEIVDEELVRINNWEDIQNRLVKYFKNSYSGRVKPEHIFDALFIILADKKKLEWKGSLLDIDISYTEALTLLEDFDFDVLLNPIDTSPNILPERLRIQFKVLIKVRGLIWIIHRYDADPFPSNPHAHQVENNIKLDLSNGMCYKHGNLVHIINKKELLQIREEAKKVFKGDLPLLTL